MVYGATHRVQHQLQRQTALEDLWDQLRRLPAPEACKWTALQQCFWQRVFHAISICPLGWEHIRRLRASAMKALGYKRGGASPALRLFFLCPPACDPGFFQAWTVFATFWRMLRKHPVVGEEWGHFMARYDGRVTHGPFAKLLEQGQLLSWTLDPPFVHDHHALAWNLLDISKTELYTLLQDAWQERMAAEVTHRKDLVGLQGVDRLVMQAFHKTVPAVHPPLVKLMQDGSFLGPWQHGKFDVTVEGRCPLCGALDSLEHRARWCPELDVPERSQIEQTEWASWTEAAIKESLLGFLLSHGRSCSCNS